MVAVMRRHPWLARRDRWPAQPFEVVRDPLWRRCQILFPAAVHHIDQECDPVRAEEGGRDHRLALVVIEVLPILQGSLEPTLGQGEGLSQVVDGADL